MDKATLLAIYGKETSYGSYTGNFNLLEVLASLAYEGRCRGMFETEFLAALKLIQGGVPRVRDGAVYAGATGLPQFKPTVVLRLRADGDGDGIAGIWGNEVDALASMPTIFATQGGSVACAGVGRSAYRPASTVVPSATRRKHLNARPCSGAKALP